jgi:hypothetical protein
LGLVQRVVARALPQIDRRFDWRVDRKIEERVLPGLPQQLEALSSLSQNVSEGFEKALFTMSELRRWMIDDLQAATETTILLGESLTRLQTSVERLEAELGSMSERLIRIEGALADPDRAGSGVPGT